jgi:hypothetical protein
MFKPPASEARRSPAVHVDLGLERVCPGPLAESGNIPRARLRDCSPDPARSCAVSAAAERADADPSKNQSGSGRTRSPASNGTIDHSAMRSGGRVSRHQINARLLAVPSGRMAMGTVAPTSCRAACQRFRPACRHYEIELPISDRSRTASVYPLHIVACLLQAVDELLRVMLVSGVRF